GDVLGAVGPGQLEDEGAVGAGGGGGGAGGKAVGLGGRRFGGRAGAGGREGVGRVGVGAFGARPRHHDRGGGVGAAGERGGDRAARTAEEAQLHVFHRLLGVLGEGGTHLAGHRVGRDATGELEGDPQLFVFDHDVEGEEGIEGVVEGPRQIDRSLQRVRELGARGRFVDKQRRDRLRGAERGGVRAVRRFFAEAHRARADRRGEADLGRRAAFAAVARRGGGRHPPRQRHRRVAQG